MLHVAPCPASQYLGPDIVHALVVVALFCLCVLASGEWRQAGTGVFSKDNIDLDSSIYPSYEIRIGLWSLVIVESIDEKGIA